MVRLNFPCITQNTLKCQRNAIPDEQFSIRYILGSLEWQRLSREEWQAPKCPFVFFPALLKEHMNTKRASLPFVRVLRFFVENLFEGFGVGTPF